MKIEVCTAEDVVTFLESEEVQRDLCEEFSREFRLEQRMLIKEEGFQKFTSNEIPRIKPSIEALVMRAFIDLLWKYVLTNYKTADVLFFSDALFKHESVSDTSARFSAMGERFKAYPATLGRLVISPSLVRDSIAYRLLLYPSHDAAASEWAELQSFFSPPEPERVPGIAEILKQREKDNMKNYLVLIGIGKYLEWTELKGPLEELEKVKDVLCSGSYGFETVAELMDDTATELKIRQTLWDLQDLEEDSNLLIYYSGHGHHVEYDDNYYLIAYDGASSDLHQGLIRDRWIEQSSIICSLDKIPCRHILFVCDACFSGKLKLSYRGIPAYSSQYFDKAIKIRSREVITSCNEEKTPDVSGGENTSSFAQAFLSSLRDNERRNLGSSTLFSDLRDRVPGLNPQHGALPFGGHENGGEFFFVQSARPQKNMGKNPERHKGIIRSVQPDKPLSSAGKHYDPGLDDKFLLN
ncbi:caspase family protein [Pontiellaceae bacterium B12227]|nr:caspase family protein [Pontiellaceae bacterium B12227]